MLVLAATLAAAGYQGLRSYQRSQLQASGERAAVAAAKDCVAATQAPDVAAIAVSQQKIMECVTGDFGAQAALYTGVLMDAYEAAKAHVEVADIGAAVERPNDDGSVTVLVALRVKLSNSEVQGQEAGYRLRVQMVRDGETYKIAKLDQVTT